ncbi:rCG62334 [Rattus norvegicus]|uniref:RCG62334 n=1 Tax=Rattus norvegicus TaxID=10116 RepID=A6HAZ3_RAT|nr:rCG62334 [Rattus norvegicus]
MCRSGSPSWKPLEVRPSPWCCGLRQRWAPKATGPRYLGPE